MLRPGRVLTALVHPLAAGQGSSQAESDCNGTQQALDNSKQQGLCSGWHPVGEDKVRNLTSLGSLETRIHAITSWWIGPDGWMDHEEKFILWKKAQLDTDMDKPVVQTSLHSRFSQTKQKSLSQFRRTFKIVLAESGFRLADDLVQVTVGGENQQLPVFDRRNADHRQTLLMTASDLDRGRQQDSGQIQNFQAWLAQMSSGTGTRPNSVRKDKKLQQTSRKSKKPHA